MAHQLGTTGLKFLRSNSVFTYLVTIYVIDRHLFVFLILKVSASYTPVSYTHLDVYKRQSFQLSVVGTTSLAALFSSSPSMWQKPPLRKQLAIVFCVT